jgi:energy-coupling factor transport system permease protein
MPVATDFIAGQYYPEESVIHRTDPRVKLLLVFYYALAIFFINNFTGFAVAAVLIGGLVILGRIPVVLTLKGIRPLFYILVFTLIIHLWADGGPWMKIGPIGISSNGLREGIFVGLRLIFLVVGASFLTLTSTPVELTNAIEHILSPLKRAGIPAHEVAMMMTIALRFMPILSTEADKVIKAQIARGASFEAKNPITRARSFIPILIPLFIGAFRRADELAEAMEARAYRGGEGRTRLKELKMGPGDWIGLIMLTALFAGMVWVGRLPVF